MNTIPAQQLDLHADLRRRELVDGLTAARGRRRHRPARRSALALATAIFGAGAFLAGGLLDAGTVNAKPPAVDKPPAAMTATAPDCVAQNRPTERTVNLHARTHRQHDRHDQIAV